MSIFSRFSAIFKAQANQAAYHFEDPKASLDYSLARLEENRNQLNRSLVQVAAAKNLLEGQRSLLDAAIRKYEEQARAAVQSERDDLATTALARKQEAEYRRTEFQANLDALEKQLEDLKQQQSNLERKISLFWSKKEELKAIYDSSKAQLQVREAVSGISQDLADVGNTIRRIEARIQEMQSRSDAIEGLISEGVLTDGFEPQIDEVDRELSRIQHDHLIQEELARLKGEVAGHTEYPELPS